jgi:twinkle protein
MSVVHEPCPTCSSKDNLARYPDGGAYCFGCGYYEHADGQQTKPTTKGSKPVLNDLEYRPLTKRGINLETVKKFNYQVGTHKGKAVQVANFKDATGKPKGQKLRYADKSFNWTEKSDTMFGQHLWNDGRSVTVFEGELDCLSFSQLMNHKYACCSVTSGAQGAKAQLAKHLEWLEGFDEVVLMFDEDKPGRDAVAECVTLFSPGKVKVAHLPLKDANECLVAGRGADVVQAFWKAKPWRPDGILDGQDTWDLLTKTETQVTKDYPWEHINKFVGGIQQGQLTTITAGTGIGKSLFTRELAYSLLKQGETIGYVALEENCKRTVQGFCSISLDVPLHLKPDSVNREQLREAWEATAGSGRLYLYDNFGSMETDNLLSRIRYLNKSAGCSFVVLDHISIVVSGLDQDNERKAIDIVMTKLRSLVEETGVGLILVSHLKRLSGDKSHEDGAVTSISHLRGSAAIGQLSDKIVSLERDQQSEDRDKTTVRVLKNRDSGITGVAGQLRYNTDTGRLTEATAFDKEEEVIF